MEPTLCCLVPAEQDDMSNEKVAHHSTVLAFHRQYLAVQTKQESYTCPALSFCPPPSLFSLHGTEIWKSGGTEQLVYTI